MVAAWSLFRKTYEATVLPSFESRMHSPTCLPLCTLTKNETITQVAMFLNDVPLPVGLSGVKGFL